MRWLMPYDLYERHFVVSRLLKDALGMSQEASRILDVGGRAELLEQFVPDRVVSINIDGSGDLLGSGLALPFADNALSAVVSIDTLEHLPQEVRVPFLRECLRVARQCVVVAAPFGSEGHKGYERELAALYQSLFGEPHIYLSEHVRHGLPTLADIDDFAVSLQQAKRVKRFFAGDYLWQGRQFERGIRASRKSAWRRHFLNLYNQVTSLALFHPVRLQSSPDPKTNRFYLLIEK